MIDPLSINLVSGNMWRVGYKRVAVLLQDGAYYFMSTFNIIINFPILYWHEIRLSKGLRKIKRGESENTHHTQIWVKSCY